MTPRSGAGCPCFFDMASGRGVRLRFQRSDFLRTSIAFRCSPQWSLDPAAVDPGASSLTNLAWQASHRAPINSQGSRRRAYLCFLRKTAVSERRVRSAPDSRGFCARAFGLKPSGDGAARINSPRSWELKRSSPARVIVAAIKSFFQRTDPVSNLRIAKVAFSRRIVRPCNPKRKPL